MEDLIEFLTARLDERKSVILDGWDSDGVCKVATMWTGGEPGYTTVASGRIEDVWIADGREVEDARHVQVLWDPAVELADITAKRAILARHDAVDDSLHYVYCAWCSTPSAGAYQPWPCPDVRDLVQPYASHSEFREARRVAP